MSPLHTARPRRRASVSVPSLVTALSLVAASFLFSASGCVPDAPKAPKAPRPPPARFTSGDRGPSLGTVPWEEYFVDPRLTTLIRHAVGNNPDIPMALQRVELARAYVKATTGAQYPQVALGVGAGLRKFGLYTMDGAGNITTDITPGQIVPTHLPDYSVGVQAAWEVDLWGKLSNQKRSAAARYLASVEAVQSVVSLLVSDVAQAYFELLAADVQHEVLNETIERQKDAVEVVRWQKVAGRATELAVQQFDVQLLNTRALLAEASQRVTLSENQLNLLMGRYPAGITRDNDVLFQETVPRLSVGVPSELLRNRPDVREAELRLEAAKCDIAAAKAAFYPSLTLSAGVGLQAFNPRYLLDVPESVTYGLSAGILAPLINRSALEADFAASNAVQLEALYQYQKTILEAFFEVNNALTQLATAREVLQLKRQQTDQVRAAIDTSDALYRAGKATYLEVLLAQQAQLDSRLELVEAAKTVRLNLVDLYRALGGGWR